MGVARRRPVRRTVGGDAGYSLVARDLDRGRNHGDIAAGAVAAGEGSEVGVAGSDAVAAANHPTKAPRRAQAMARRAAGGVGEEDSVVKIVNQPWDAAADFTQRRRTRKPPLKNDGIRGGDAVEEGGLCGRCRGLIAVREGADIDLNASGCEETLKLGDARAR